MGRREVLGVEGVVRRFRILLMACGIYLEDIRLHRAVTCLVLANSFVACLQMSYSMYLYFLDIGRLATLGHHNMLLIDIFIGLTVYNQKRPQILRMVAEMINSHDYESKLMVEYTVESQALRARQMDRMHKLLVFAMCFLLLNLIVNSYVEKQMTDAEYILLYPSWFPFNLDYIHNHLLGYFWQMVNVSVIDLLVNGVVAFTYLVYVHITSEFKLLEHALETTGARALELAETGLGLKEAYIRCINHCAMHHSEITRYFQDAKDFYRYIYLASFITGLVVCVCVGLAFVSDNMAIQIKFVGVTILQMFILFTLCWFGEMISEESERMRFVIYGIGWYDMPRECQSTLRLMAESTFRPMSLVSATGHKADLDTFMSMIKASYSYFNMMVAARS